MTQAIVELAESNPAELAAQIAASPLAAIASNVTVPTFRTSTNNSVPLVVVKPHPCALSAQTEVSTSIGCTGSRHGRLLLQPRCASIDSNGVVLVSLCCCQA